MRLGPFDIRRRAGLSAEAADVPAAPKELGSSGTINIGGFLQSLEYNQDLRHPRELEVFERMRSSDGSVQEAFGHITAPVKNADWDIQAVSEDPLDLEVAEACRRAFFTWPAQPFEEYLDNALDYLIFGHQVFEQVWQVVEDELEVEDPESGDVTSLPNRQFLAFRRFAPRAQKTIWRWQQTEGELDAIVQQVYQGASFVTVEIPADRLVVYTSQRRGDDFRGRSLLRPAYKHWLLKELFEKIEGVGLERHGIGTWVAYLPADRQNDQALVERVEEILENLRAGAYNYIVAPFPKQQNATAGANGGSFEIISPANAIPDFKPAKEYHRGEIKGSMLVRFSELGHSSIGARATGDTQSKIWYDALHAVARHFAAVNQIPIKRFVDANYPGVRKYPTLVARNIESRTLAEFAQAHSQLVSSGAVEPDQPYRAAVRDVLGMPPEAPETQAQLDEAGRRPTAIPPGTQPPPGDQPVDEQGNPIEQE